MFIRGDCDQSQRLNITDPIFTLEFLFADGREPVCFDACDSNDSERVDIADPIYTLLYLFADGAEPRPPFPHEGADPTAAPLPEDDIGCSNGRTPAAEVRISPREVRFERLGDALALRVVSVDATGIPADVHDAPTIVYDVADPSIAEVDGAGVVTATGIGRTSLSVRYAGAVRTVPIVVPAGADGGPTIRVISPLDGSIVRSDAVIVSGLVARTTAVMVNGDSLEVDDDRFSGEVELTLGGNLLRVVAMGDPGLEAAEEIRVTRVARDAADVVGPDGRFLPVVPEPFVSSPDTRAPTVLVTSPEPGSTVASSIVHVEGTVDENDVFVTVGGVAALVADRSFRATLSLPPGESTVRVIATDALENVGESEFRVRVEAAAPRLAIVDPPDAPTLVFGRRTARLRGTVSPPGATVVANGRRAEVNGSTWQVDVAFRDGVQRLVLAAQSFGAAGAPVRSQLVRSVVVDESPPLVELAFPPDGEFIGGAAFETDASTLLWTGRIEDAGGAPRPFVGTLAIDIDGVAATVSRNAFSASVPVPPGANDLELVARDARGNELRRRLSVVRRSFPRSFELLSPAVSDSPRGSNEFLRVRVTESGRVVPNVEVVWSIRWGESAFESPGTGVRERTTRTFTDASGVAAVAWSAGEAAGLQTVVVRSRDCATRSFVRTVAHGDATLLVTRRDGPFVVSTDEGSRSIPVRLFDLAGNEIPDEDITTEVIAGGASLGGAQIARDRTNAHGIVSVIVTVPPDDDSESLLRLSHRGGAVLELTVEGRKPGAAADTDVVGTIAYEDGAPIAGARITLAGWESTPGLIAATDAFGRFRIGGAPSGCGVIQITSELGTASRPIETLTGRRLELGRISLPQPELVDARRRSLSATQVETNPNGARVVLPALPGAQLHLTPLDLITSHGEFTLAAPHLHVAPASAPDGTHPIGLVGVLPEDGRFARAPAIALPAIGSAGDQRFTLYEFRAAAGGFVDLGTTVVEAGTKRIDVPRHLAPRSGGYFFAAPSRRPPSGDTVVGGQIAFVGPEDGQVPQRARSEVLGFQVYAHSGELYVEEEDLVVRGRGLSFRFGRRYESRHEFVGSLGNNWEHDYEDRRIYPGLGGRNIVRANGRGSFDEYLYDANADGYISPIGVFSHLWRVAEGWIERDPEGIRYEYESFDGTARAGRLAAIEDAAGNRMEFTRKENGRIDFVRDSLGRRIVYEHDERGRVRRVTDFTGRRVEFEYDARGDLVAVTGPAVVGLPTPNLFPNGKRSEYRYSSGFDDERLNHNLTQIIDPAEVIGAGRARVTIEYGEGPDIETFDRVTAQEWSVPDGNGSESSRAEFDYASLVAPGRPDPANVEDLEEALLGPAARTDFTNARGVRSRVISSGAGLPLVVRVYTSPALDDLRARDPTRRFPTPGVAPRHYETRREWTREGLLRAITHPGGDRTRFEHDERAPLRHAQAAITRVVEVPLAEAPGEATPAVTTYRRDPFFGRVLELVPPRGNRPGANAEDFVERSFVDYQEGTEIDELASRVGRDVDTVRAALLHAGIELGLGDLNGDGETSRAFGRIVRVVRPPLETPAGGSEESIATKAYNRFGQLVEERDGSGRLVRFRYHSETDPEGDGTATNGEGLDPETGGFLAAEIRVLDEAAGDEIARSFRYDEWGHPRELTDGRGNTLIHTYNALGQLVQIQFPSPLRYRRQVFYDASDRATLVRLENFSMTDGGIPFAVAENRWFETRIDYDILHRPIRVEREIEEGELTGEARAAITRIHYTPTGEIARIERDGDEASEAWRYDERGLPLWHARGPGTADEAAITNLRDAAGQPVVRIDAADSDGDGEPERQRFVRDGFHRSIAEIDALGGARIIARDVEGRALDEAIVGDPGRVGAASGGGDSPLVLLARRSWTYNARGGVETSRRELFGGITPEGDPLPPETLITRYWYDGADRLIARRDPLGLLTEREYDGAGRLERIREPSGTTEFLRDGNGNILRETRETLTLEPLVSPPPEDDPEFDASGRYRERRSVVRVFDPLDRPSVTITASGGVWRARYDAASNIILVTDPEGPNLNPDADPEIAGVVDLIDPEIRGALNAHGNHIRYRYDNLGRLVESAHELRAGGTGGGSIDRDNPFNNDGLIVEKYGYDASGRLSSRTDDRGNVTAVEYDAAGHPRAKTYPGGTTETYRYDRDGNLLELRDAGGSVFRQEFDALHRVVTRRIERGEGIAGTTLQRFTYDGLSRVRSSLDNNDPDEDGDDALRVVSFDSLGRRVEEIQAGFPVRSGYDRNGRLTWRRHPDGRTIFSPRDVLGAQRSLADGAGPFAEYRYFGSGDLLEKVLPNDARLSFLRARGDETPRRGGYHRTGEPLELLYTNSAGAIVVGFEYGRNRLGDPVYRLPRHQGDGRGDAWRFDSVYRLRRFIPNVFNPASPPPDPTEKLDVFPDGNHNWHLVEVDFQRTMLEVNERNEYTSSGDEAYSYDGAGNLTATDRLRFQYDALARLVEVQRDGELVARYTYDATGSSSSRAFRGRGQRTWKRVAIPARGQPAGEVAFLYAGSELIEERVLGGALRQFVWEEISGTRSIAARIERVGSEFPAVDFFIGNAERSTAAILDTAGAIVETTRFDAHGIPRIINPSGLDLAYSRRGNSGFLPGAYYDYEIGMHLVGARHFDPSLGRYLSRGGSTEPLTRAPLGLNPYLVPSLGGIAGAVTGEGTALRRDPAIEPLRVHAAHRYVEFSVAERDASGARAAALSLYPLGGPRDAPRRRDRIDRAE